MAEASDDHPHTEGLRQRKRRETSQRIIEVGMQLFIARGIEATTLDDIAAAAGISRRTFFYYFKSKDDILLSLHNMLGEKVAMVLKHTPETVRPLHAVRDAIIAVLAAIPADDMIAIDRIMRSSETVQARKQAAYVQHERTLYTSLCEVWPQPEKAMGLRLVAMVSIGAMRLATETLNREGGTRPMTVLLREAFDALESEI